ncbi:MAG TPA: low temperature requirement protein A [Pyrinomonadaceae bacterium]|nr:low temperature requirement protein A [Pyrinomonadaceae bacterium]
MAETPEGMRRIKSRPHLRTLEPNVMERHASWLELFFDLVFVLAVSQVALILTGHTDLWGFLKYVVLFIPVWYSWIGFTYYADRFETEEAVYRIWMFAGMLAVLGFSLTLGNAFTTGGDAPLIICYACVRLSLIVLYARAAYYVPLARPFCLQFIGGLGSSLVLLFISLLFESPTRYVIWFFAQALEFATPFLNIKATRLIPIDRTHIPERFGLFTIIVLGEAVIATAAGASEVHWNFATVATASLGFAMAACIWWINFDFVEDNAVRSESLFPRFAYIYGHFFIVSSIVATGIGVEHAIKQSGESHLHFQTLLLLAGGTAVYLSAVTIIRMLSGICKMVNVRIAAIILTVLILLLGPYLPPLAVMIGLFVLMTTGIWIEGLYVMERPEQEESSQLHPCGHESAALVFEPRSAEGCEQCVINNYKWVHLRLCLTCGHTGCCDTSVYKHATKHFHESGHPIMASLEPGEHWSWCYIDEKFIPVPENTKAEK